MKLHSPADLNFRMERTALDQLFSRISGAYERTAHSGTAPIVARIQKGIYVQADEKRLSVLLDSILANFPATQSDDIVVSAVSFGGIAKLAVTASQVNGPAFHSSVTEIRAAASSIGIELGFSRNGHDKWTVECILPLCAPQYRA